MRSQSGGEVVGNLVSRVSDLCYLTIPHCCPAPCVDPPPRLSDSIHHTSRHNIQIPPGAAPPRYKLSSKAAARPSGPAGYSEHSSLNCPVVCRISLLAIISQCCPINTQPPATELVQTRLDKRQEGNGNANQIFGVWGSIIQYSPDRRQNQKDRRSRKGAETPDSQIFSSFFLR